MPSVALVHVLWCPGNCSKAEVGRRMLSDGTAEGMFGYADLFTGHGFESFRSVGTADAVRVDR